MNNQSENEQFTTKNKESLQNEAMTTYYTIQDSYLN
jgi:hypothetical protein